MTDARQNAAAAIDALTPGFAVRGAFSIPLEEDPPYTATSLLLIRRYWDAAEATRGIVTTLYGEYRVISQPNMHQDPPNPGDRRGWAGERRCRGSRRKRGTGLRRIRPAWSTMVLAGKLDRLLAADFPNSVHAIVGYRVRYTDAVASLGQRAPRSRMTRGLPG